MGLTGPSRVPLAFGERSLRRVLPVGRNRPQTADLKADEPPWRRTASNVQKDSSFRPVSAGYRIRKALSGAGAEPI